jgi:outer membrane protein TolC
MKKLNYSILALAILLFLAFTALRARAEGIAPGESLTLSRAVQIALKNQPSIMSGVASVRASEARIGQARSNYYPQLAATGNYTRSSTPGSSNGISGNGANDHYSSNVFLNQNVYDFGRTSSQVAIQKFNTQSARSELQNTTDQVVFNAKQAYYNLLETERAKAVAQEAIIQFEKHLDQARGFFEVGTKPKFDVTKAEVDLSNARLNLIRAENNVNLARVTLNNAMGLPDAPPYTLQDTLSYVRYELLFEDAIKKAESQRADLQSLRFRESASKESISLARKGYLPSLSGSAGYTFAGSGFPLDEGWNYGLSLNVPIFTGFLTKYQVAEAQANADTLRSNEQTLRQDILLQVQRGYIALREAAESIQTTELAVRQAKENLDLANGRYEAGVGSPIEVTDAVVAYSDAQLAYSRSLYAYKIARATIERAIGERL